METVESLLSIQAERYADVSYFPPFDSPSMSPYFPSAAFEYELVTHSSGYLESVISSNNSRNMVYEACHDYLESLDVRGMALGVFVSVQLITGRSHLSVPWVMAKEWGQNGRFVQHSAVAAELIGDMMKFDIPAAGLTEGYGYVLNIADRKTVFVLDSYRQKRILAARAVRTSLRDSLSALHGLEVVYKGKVFTAK